jgi:hypothetical protein
VRSHILYVQAYYTDRCHQRKTDFLLLTVLRSHEILVRIRIRGSMRLTNGSGIQYSLAQWNRRAADEAVVNNLLKNPINLPVKKMSGKVLIRDPVHSPNHNLLRSNLRDPDPEKTKIKEAKEKTALPLTIKI